MTRPLISIGRQITLRGEIRALDGTNGADANDPRWELLPSGQLRVTLLVDLDEQPRSCRRCGCTDSDACYPGCYWVETELCSECKGRPLSNLERAIIARFEGTDLAEQGRLLASEREDLIAAGVDPSELVVPLHPDRTGSTR